MNRQFIEFRGEVIMLPKDVTSKEAWLIAYNQKKQNIVQLAKLWTCHTELGCTYAEENMKELSNLKAPFTFQASSSNHW